MQKSFSQLYQEQQREFAAQKREHFIIGAILGSCAGFLTGFVIALNMGVL